MYLDSKGYVTTGMGNLIDTVGAANALPWKRANGEEASPSEIARAWNAVKARTDLSQQGGGAFENVTSLRLSDFDIQRLIASKLEQFEGALKGSYPNFENWPADAQMGALSMAWAMGPGYPARFPRFSKAVNQLLPDFELAAVESSMVDPIPRNAMNRALFENAAYVLQKNLDPTRLYYPRILNVSGGGSASGSSGYQTSATPSSRGGMSLAPLALAGLASAAWFTRGKWLPLFQAPMPKAESKNAS
jgi:hypothetical protein